MTEIVAWYIHGILGGDAPESFDDLRRTARRRSIPAETLLNTDKWDFLIREDVRKATPGFTRLGAMASTKRGIATGANDFFHLSKLSATEHGLPSHALKPCVGRAADVRGFDFMEEDFSALVRDGRRSHLVMFGRALGGPERAYIAKGEAEGLPDRYLLAARRPWHSMEIQTPAPIWAAVFGRRGLRFIRNSANVLTLTTFHCIYPFDVCHEFADALALCLNLPSIQADARAHTRVYGGGLLKFEPKDILEILVPDLRRVSFETVRRLAAEHVRVASEFRTHGENGIDWTSAELTVRSAAHEAANHRPEEPVGMRRDQAIPGRQQDARKHHGGQGVSGDVAPQRLESRRKSLPVGPTLWES